MEAYDYYFRNMYNITKDGTFGWNSNAGKLYGSTRIKIDPTRRFGYAFVQLTEVTRPDGIESYYIYDGDDKVQVSLEEFSAYHAQFCQERIEFHRFTEENIEKYVVVDAVTQRCQCKH